MDKKRKDKVINPADKYRGVGVNDADNDKVNSFLTKQDTYTLNNNPRNTELEGQ